MITRKQKKLIDRFEFAIANFVFDGNKQLAREYEQIINAMNDGNFVMAVIEAECSGVPPALIMEMRKTFKVALT